MSNWQDLQNNPRLKSIYETRIKVIRLIREFFWLENFVETDTPVAVRFPGQEPYLNPVPVDIHNPNSEAARFYLQTSPEFAMKKLLAVGFDKIFQLAKCWRDYESFGGTHNTEFTMLEWYRSPGTLVEIMDDTEKLIKFVDAKLALSKIYNLQSNYDRISVKELWQKYVDVDFNELLEINKMRDFVKSCGYQVSEEDAYEDLFYKVFLNKIESHLGKERPVFVYDYPAQMCSLSNLSQKDQRYAERFELYINGLELANAFGELTNPVKQLYNLEQDQAKRQELGREIFGVDKDFIESLSNIPSAGGIALGVDRLVMILTEAKDINEVIFGSVADQLVN
ncbi:MAG: Lysine-tRNA ligase [Candidatus Magasanikbacteria bacterium GW2011_GWC2_34_16]|uniref:Lysine-tRNA ligase n=2 Tax=Candidatus Magasanikiibacteriota TaxID=1752731 RepID=A0A0G0KKP2_9BACT|nr:MAG: Lysine-tRNA ligase [Candidatus Magasanikbacteria bacterium GW2011_GWC2_34_16]KKQ41141.1 MAG: Lysine-tRNA ligase [Candidatus Magasanikbacteria bacterium GW2011_GWA2_37_8]